MLVAVITAVAAALTASTHATAAFQAGRGQESARKALHATLRQSAGEGAVALATGDTGAAPTSSSPLLESEGKGRHLLLAIAVPSARHGRREAIRQTWLRWGDDRVVLRFFTGPVWDRLSSGPSQILAEERAKYGDIVEQDIGQGMNFGLKLLSAMRWFSQMYTFDYFLRLDDDYFLCLSRLIRELEVMKYDESRLPIYAGYRACNDDLNISYVDESYMLMSGSLVQRVLSSEHLQCSAYGSLTAGAWFRHGAVGNRDGDVQFVMDTRLDRWGSWWERVHPSDAKSFETAPSLLCEQNIGVHKTYSTVMHKLWQAGVLPGNGSELTFEYVDDGECPYVANGVTDEALANDNGQLCDYFLSEDAGIFCGGQGC